VPAVDELFVFDLLLDQDFRSLWFDVGFSSFDYNTPSSIGKRASSLLVFWLIMIYPG
jgi:hypothetical protein